MKNKNTFGVHFILRSRRDANGLCPVYVRITVNGGRVELSVKSSLNPGDWNAGKGAAKPKTAELKEFNSYLEELRSQLLGHYRELNLRSELPTAEAVKNAYLGMDEKGNLKAVPQKEEEKTLRWLVSEHNTIMKTVLKQGSMKNYYTTERYVWKFLEAKYKSADLALKDLNYSFLTAFEHFVRTTPLKANDPCTTNGTMKHIERLKKMATWAFNNEWIGKNPFCAYSLKFKHTPVEFLEEQELSTIENRHFNDPLKQKVKDIFVFCCYTGLCYADVMALTPANIVIGTDGFTWIKTTRAKTDIAFDVPLLEKAAIILEQFNNRKGELPRNTVFPYITNQEVNRSLKVIAEVCSIPKRLTFHLARHTFATTVTLANNVPIESISKMMGHTKLATTMIYAKVVNTKISKDMALLQGKLGKPRTHLRAV